MVSSSSSLAAAGGSRKDYEDRLTVSTTHGFLDAFMSVQSIPTIQLYGIIGFLRDRGA